MNNNGLNLLLGTCLCASLALGVEKPNVLFIAVDDLRTELGCYGVENAITPHMDAFADSARLFRNHFVQVATCGASRYALLTGTLPRTPADQENSASHTLKRGPSTVARTMPELFRKNGYRTVCFGKISHESEGMLGNRPELPEAWDELLTPRGQWAGKGSLLFAYANGRVRDIKTGFMQYCEFADVADNELPDGLMADAAVERITQFAESGEPFFMGVGFFKPHLPFVAPKKYKDQFDGVALPSPYGMQRGDTKKAGQSGEFYKYKTNRPFDKPKWNATLAEADAQEIRRGYYACVSYTDAQVGRVLRALDESGLAENTIVVLWGDHGWHLGEHNAWAKHTPLETSLKSPLILRVPGLPSPGKATDSLAASIDLYPTLIDLCNLEQRKTARPLDGVSLRSVLNDPTVQVRQEVLSFWSDTSMTDGRYRLLVSLAKDTGGYSFELYDHKNDPGELKNVAAQNPEVIQTLMKRLKRVYPQVLIK